MSIGNGKFAIFAVVASACLLSDSCSKKTVDLDMVSRAAPAADFVFFGICTDKNLGLRKDVQEVLSQLDLREYGAYDFIERRTGVGGVYFQYKEADCPIYVDADLQKWTHPDKFKTLVAVFTAADRGRNVYVWRNFQFHIHSGTKDELDALLDEKKNYNPPLTIGADEDKVPGTLRVN